MTPRWKLKSTLWLWKKKFLSIFEYKNKFARWKTQNAYVDVDDRRRSSTSTSTDNVNNRCVRFDVEDRQQRRRLSSTVDEDVDSRCLRSKLMSTIDDRRRIRRSLMPSAGTRSDEFWRIAVLSIVHARTCGWEWWDQWRAITPNLEDDDDENEDEDDDDAKNFVGSANLLF